MRGTNMGRGSLASAALSAAVLAVLMVGGANVASGAPMVLANPYNDVQVLVLASSDSQYSYYFTAYNLTGQLVASSQTPYPAAAFELPSGTYLFTVSAVGQSTYGCPMCEVPPMKAPSSGSGVSSPGQNGSGGVVSYPIRYVQPSSEYGYSVLQVSGPVTLQIDTQNVTKLATSDVSVKVSFLNGTAASNVSVSASVVGQWYYWWGSDSKISMWSQTGPDGVAHLVLPEAPAVVSAWDWIPLNVPSGQNATKTDVGGQKVNVTVYWEQTFIGLAASALYVPPADAVSLTLQYQQPNYWVMPMGALVAPSTASAPGASVSNDRRGVPSGTQQAASIQGPASQFFLPSSIPSLNTSPVSGGGYLSTMLEGVALGAGLSAAAVGSYTLIRRRRSL